VPYYFLFAAAVFLTAINADLCSLVFSAPGTGACRAGANDAVNAFGI
jgi:hypothetical protein